MPRNDAENRFRDIMRASGIIKINGTDYPTEMKDLRELEELGDGTSGHVVKMLHIPSGAVIAVKQMRRTGNAEENKRIVNDIETALKAHGCPYIVQCLGFIITSADVWICMELMATCFDKLLKRTSRPVPEEILGKVTVAVSPTHTHDESVRVRVCNSGSCCPFRSTRCNQISLHRWSRRCPSSRTRTQCTAT